MISSMTGFGGATAEVDGIVYTVEFRTVNNRYLKTNLRLSDTIAFCEDEVEKAIRRQIHRGTVNCNVRMQNVSGHTFFDVDQNALTEYIEKLRAVAQQNRIDYQIDLADLLNLPGAVVPVIPEQDEAAQMQKTVLDLVDQAIEKLKQMRREEGQCLKEELLSHCKVIAERLVEIRTRAGSVVEQYRDRLQKRVDELLADTSLQMDDDTLAREVAVYAERCDIAEEVARLDSHLQQFAQCCENRENVGRRLDFISQEMLREANTIASKASDVEICRWVIDIKCAVDRIKEQVQNVE